MPKMILLFSHKLTKNQIEDAKLNLGVDDFLYLTDDLQSKWSGIPPEIDSINEYLIPFKKYLIENSEFNDYVLIQGDFGAVYGLVNFSFSLGLKPIYATTQREIDEHLNEEGNMEKKSIFKFRRFREYGL